MLRLLQPIVRRLQAVQQAPVDPSAVEDIFTERERAQVTLESIDDAVASTDFRGRIVYLNKAAERLTGYRQDFAKHLPVAEVFRLVDASTGEVMQSLTAVSIIDNQKRVAPDGSQLERRDGTKVAVEISSTPIHDRHGGVVGAVIVARDITAARDLSERLSRLALYDPLTGLPNRSLFSDRLDSAISRANRTGSSFCLMYIDLDHFKMINDTLGHVAGDQLLQHAAQRLQGCVRESDTVSRHGGDEFVALLMDCVGAEAASLCAAKIVEAMSVPYELNGRQLGISASVGFALFPFDATDRETLHRAADSAMYRAKCAGRNGFRRFDGNTEISLNSEN